MGLCTTKSLALGLFFLKAEVLWAIHEDSAGIRSCREDDRMISLRKTTDQEILQASMTSALLAQGRTRSSAASVATSWAIKNQSKTGSFGISFSKTSPGHLENGNPRR